MPQGSGQHVARKIHIRQYGAATGCRVARRLVDHIEEPESVAVKYVVTQDETDVIATDKIVADQKRLRQTIR